MTDPEQQGAKVIRLITGGKEGTLTTPAGRPVPVRVYERPSDVLMLVVMVGDAVELESETVEPLLLEYASANGLVRFRGHAVLEARDLVSFQVSTEPEVLQRRDFVRVEAMQPVVIATEDGERELDTHALDISGGGMLLTRLDTLAVGRAVRFSLQLDEGEPVLGRAHVVRAAGEGRRALVFDEISRADRERLIRFIFERQRAAIAEASEKPAPHRGAPRVSELPKRPSDRRMR